MTAARRVLLVDDSPVVLSMVEAALRARPSLEVVGAVGSAEAAIRGLHRYRPDLVLMDANMPGMDGIEGTKAIRARSPVDKPARAPESRSACFTQLSRVCAVHPILAAIETIAAHRDACSAPCSITIRTARARTSGEYFAVCFLLLDPVSQGVGPPTNPGRFKARMCVSVFILDFCQDD
jgi:CheY-like chemotaxis protein